MKAVCVILLLIMVGLYTQLSCSLIKKEVTLRSILIRHYNCSLLDSEERELLDNIIVKIGYSQNPVYYTGYLILLLDTPFNMNRDHLREDNNKELNKSLGLNAPRYSNKKEARNNDLKHWEMYSPDGENYYYYVNRIDPLDLHILITIKINTDKETKEKIQSLEYLIEKHMSVPGFSVNIQWSNDKQSDVVEVSADPNEWATAKNWAGDHFTIAHELFHIFGLEDEYNRIESHADNEYITYRDRLSWFIYQMNVVPYKDATDGIMVYNTKKPLPRHVCWSVGLGDECIAARTLRHGTYHEIK